MAGIACSWESENCWILCRVRGAEVLGAVGSLIWLGSLRLFLESRNLILFSLIAVERRVLFQTLHGDGRALRTLSTSATIDNTQKIKTCANMRSLNRITVYL
jgi:hypothetical protein